MTTSDSVLFVLKEKQTEVRLSFLHFLRKKQNKKTLTTFVKYTLNPRLPYLQIFIYSLTLFHLEKETIVI